VAACEAAAVILFKGLIGLHGVSGYRQFDAIPPVSTGAIALLALFATRQGKPPFLGDITA